MTLKKREFTPESGSVDTYATHGHVLNFEPQFSDFLKKLHTNFTQTLVLNVSVSTQEGTQSRIHSGPS